MNIQRFKIISGYAVEFNYSLNKPRHCAMFVEILLYYGTVVLGNI